MTGCCATGRARAGPTARLKRTRWSMSLFVWYFGTKGTRGMWPDVGHHTILNGPRYKGLRARHLPQGQAEPRT